MSYCTIDDLKKVLPETELIRLTNETGSGEIQEVTAEEAIETGACEVDAYIGSLAKLPLSTVPPILTKINADLAVYNLYIRVITEIPVTPSERYKNAIKLLEKIQDGRISLGIQPPLDAPTAYPQGIQVGARPKLFGRHILDKY